MGTCEQYEVVINYIAYGISHLGRKNFLW